MGQVLLIDSGIDARFSDLLKGISEKIVDAEVVTFANSEEMKRLLIDNPDACLIVSDNNGGGFSIRGSRRFTPVNFVYRGDGRLPEKTIVISSRVFGNKAQVLSISKHVFALIGGVGSDNNAYYGQKKQAGGYCKKKPPCNITTSYFSETLSDAATKAS